MGELQVPERPALTRVPGVELIHVGHWEISTGPWDVTSEDLYAAVAAQDCPAIRRPVLKLGHVDTRFDGEPAVGWVDGLAVSASGSELVGDYAGVPGWLASIMASAYPDRSVEGQYDHRCQLGHTHPFVLTAVALLGVTAPGVGTLSSLQDLAALYGIAAAETTPDTGSTIRLPVTAKGTPAMPTAQVTASTTVEDVRRAFYAGPASDNWWWIEDVFVDPPELIAVDDDSGTLMRVPFTVAGAGEVTFGEAQTVRREYIAASTTMRPALASWASRTESRPGRAPRAATTTEDEPSVVFTEAQLTSLREQLGLGDDADAATILDALAEALAERAEPVAAAAALPAGTVAVDADTLTQMQAAVQVAARAQSEQRRSTRESAVAAAVSDGRIAPARRQHWLTMLENDPDAVEVLAAMPKDLVPVTEQGHGSDRPDGVAASLDDIYSSPVYKNWSF